MVMATFFITKPDSIVETMATNPSDFTNSMQGFTLLEIIVAIAIFSVISLSVFFTMDQYFNTAEVLNRRHHETGELNRFLHMLERDLHYANNRKIRGQYGEFEDAFLLGPVDGHEVVSMTSSLPDYSNPGLSKLFRVSWSFHDGIIRRAHWRVLDRAQDSAPIRHQILQNIKAFELVLRPEVSSFDDDQPPPHRYVELTLRPEKGATINRIIRLSGEQE